jgi:hypothetical protein
MRCPIKIQRFYAGIIFGFLVCLSIQSAAYFLCHGGSAKSESNYFSTLSRFQGAVAPGAALAVTGSSLSGRLPGRESGNQDVANLGSDGGTPLDGLTLLDEGLVGRPSWIVLETNTLFSSGCLVETPAVGGARGFWFRIGGVMPLLGASARPTGMLYGQLLGRKWVGVAMAFKLHQLTSPVPPAALGDEDLNGFELERIRRLGTSLLKAQQNGTRILMVRYPAGPLKPRQIDEMNTVIARLHQLTGAPYLDLSSEVPRAELVFTDNVHLGPESAARVLATLREVIHQLETTTP